MKVRRILPPSLLAALLVVLVAAAHAAPGDLPTGKVEDILDTYAGNIYRRGQSTALVVGVTLGGKTYFRAYGHRSFEDQTGGNAVDEHSIFEIGSVTKVWTTALAGQAVATGGLTTRPVSLYTPLGSFPHPLPGLQDAMKLATLGNLASFTAGLPDVSRIVVDNPGRGYRAPPRITFSGPGAGAQAQAIVLDGKIAGIQMLGGGKGYTPGTEVVVSAKHGSGAEAEAVVSGGSVVGVVVTKPGSGYNAAPVVQIAPGDNIVNTVPVWAAAGALKSSASDLLKLCQLHLGQQEIDGNPVAADLSLGARYALLPLIENTPSTPAKFTGVTWAVDTGFIGGGLNLVISKDGALPGFATYVSLVPAADLGVVILRANNQAAKAEYAGPIGSVANAITTAIQMELLGAE